MENRLLASKLSYIAFIVLLIGAACLVFGEVNLQNVKAVVIERSGDFVWYYSFNLTKQKTYRIDIESTNTWGAVWADAGFTQPQPVNVTITSPGGGVTSLEAFFYSELPTSPYYHEGTPPTIVEVAYFNVDDAGLSANSPAQFIRFLSKQSGLYTVRVLEEGLWSKTPPNYFSLIEEYTPNVETYSVLALGGGVLGTIGGVVCVTSVFRKRPARPKKARK
jgi:hypothetical protein